MTPVKTLLTMYHLLNVLQQKKFFKSEDISQTQTKYDLLSLLQKMWQTRCWINKKQKPRLFNDKSHLKTNVKSCSILENFFASCTDRF